MAGIRPLLLPSHLEDPDQKVSFVDEHWVHVGGGRAAAEATTNAVYLVMSLRNVGNGLAILDRWDLTPYDVFAPTTRPKPIAGPASSAPRPRTSSVG